MKGTCPASLRFFVRSASVFPVNQLVTCPNGHTGPSDEVPTFNGVQSAAIMRRSLGSSADSWFTNIVRITNVEVGDPLPQVSEGNGMSGYQQGVQVLTHFDVEQRTVVSMHNGATSGGTCSHASLTKSLGSSLVRESGSARNQLFHLSRVQLTLPLNWKERGRGQLVTPEPQSVTDMRIAIENEVFPNRLLSQALRRFDLHGSVRLDRVGRVIDDGQFVDSGQRCSTGHPARTITRDCGTDPIALRIDEPHDRLASETEIAITPTERRLRPRRL